MNILAMGKTERAKILLRTGLAVVFLYTAIASLRTPADWIIFLPGFLTKVVDANLLLKIFAVYELVLAFCFIADKYVRYAALLAALTMAGILLTNLSLFSVTFRDVAIMFAALALAALE